MRYELKIEFKLDDNVFNGHLITYNLEDTEGNKTAILSNIKEDGHKVLDESSFQLIKTEVIKKYEDVKKAEFMHYRVKKDNTDTLDAIHSVINNMDYRSHFPKVIEDLAKDKNILITFGASDDLLELRGAIYDELGASNGYSYKRDENAKTFYNGVLDDIGFELIWCPSEDKSWEARVKEGVVSKSFDIIEDGNVYCTGLIISLDKVYRE